MSVEQEVPACSSFSFNHESAAYRGRVEDVERNTSIGRMIAAGQSWNTIQAATGCSRATIAKKRLKQAA